MAPQDDENKCRFPKQTDEILNENGKKAIEKLELSLKTSNSHSDFNGEFTIIGGIRNRSDGSNTFSMNEFDMFLERQYQNIT